MKRFLIPVIALFMFSLAASTSGAAVTVGQKCASNSGGPNSHFTLNVASGNSYVLPSSGVITKWGTDRTATSNPGYVALLTARQVASDLTVITGLPFHFIPPSTNAEFAARLSVTGGDILGSSTLNSEPRMCNTGSMLDDGLYGGDINVGDTFTPSTISTYRNAIWAELEPDVDGDGYGDETQDKCPQSAAYIDACPVLSIGQQLAFKKNTISVLATATVDAQLTATATVKLPKSGKSKARTVTIKGKPAAFKAGKLKTIKLKLPSSVKDALKAKKKLSATVSLTGNGLANTATASAKVKLK